MNEIRAIIVDDESAARDVLQSLILRSKSPINIIAQCSDLENAVTTIKIEKPDVVFLDVQMPNYAGYEIASFFDTINFEIIFVTAYDQFAIKAFELSAIDYLVKPINRQRLQEALSKLENKFEQKEESEKFHILLESIQKNDLGKLVISELGNKRIIALSSIIAIEAKGAYSVIHLKDQTSFMVSKNLKYFESTLPEGDVFFRSHKSWIISTNFIKYYNKGKGVIVLNQDISARISRYRIQEFDSILSLK